MGSRQIHRPLLSWSAPALAALAALAPTSNAQQERWTRFGVNRNEKFGRSVTQLGDLNSDGVPDWAVGVPLLEDTGGNSGNVRIYSGATGTQLRELSHTVGESLGFALCSAGDVDADGNDDLLVGAPGASSNFGAAYVFSGKDGTILRTYAGANPIARFGAAVANLGDVDGDLAPDYLIGSPAYQSVSPWGFGRADLVSGASGTVLNFWLGRSSTSRLGEVVCSAGDFDGDGRDDVALLELNGLGTVEVQTRVISSATGATLMNDALTPPGAMLGFSASPVDDMDGDGNRDLLVAGWSNALFGLWGAASVFGSATAAPIFTLVDTHGGFGRACCGVSDLTGDGIGDFAVSRPDVNGGGVIEVFSGSDRSILHTFTVKTLVGGAALAGGLDHDGDGVAELVIGSPVADEQDSGGRAQLRSLATGALLKEKFGRDDRIMFHAGASLFDDVDGDGIAEVLAGIANTPSPIDTFAVVVLAGADGSELKRFAVGASGGQDFGGTLIAVPDVNGDGVSEFAVAGTATTGSVEVHSGADGSLIRRITDSRSNIGFGAALAAGTQPSGAVHLAIGSPLSDAFRPDAGEVLIIDVGTGTTIATVLGNLALEQYGSSIAFAADVNSDGTNDWAVAGPRNNKNATEAGRVNVINGKTGGQLKVALGTGAGDRFGSSLSVIGDEDADGLDDLLVGVPFTGAGDEGELRVYSIKTMTLLRTIVGPIAGANFGATSAAVTDANGDALADAVSSVANRVRFDLVNGATGALMRPTFPSMKPQRLLAAPPWLVAKNGGGDGPLLLVHAPDDMTGGIVAGALALVELDDLYLQISPESAPAGVKVNAFTRGGPPGNFLLLMLELVDGIPVFVTATTGNFDSAGSFVIGDTIPVGLSGTVWTLRSYAIGFTGKTVDSQQETLTFE